ncbi:MAG: response regulator transcription factor, partial [Anaerolineae bacterium]
RKVINRFGQPEQDAKTVTIALDQLTEREIEVLRLAAKGMSNREIAQRLVISDRTVQTHLTNIFNKMGVGSRTEAVVHALRKGWITLEDTL